MITRFLLFVASLYGIWASLDGLYVNFVNPKIIPVNISEIEGNENFNARYIEIHNGYWSTGYVYKFQKDANKIHYVYSGLMSEEQSKSSSPSLKVIVKEEVNVYKHELQKWYETNRTKSPVVVSGVTMVGWDSLGSEEQELLKKLGYKVQNNLVLIEKGSSPRELWLNVTILIISACVFALFIYSLFGFFRRFKKT